MNEEVWRPIVGYEGLYEVSSYGRVRSIDRYVKYSDGRIHLYKGKVLSPSKDTGGYLFVILHCNGKRKTINIHRLVAQAFLPNPDNLPEVNHRDEDKTNNRVDNLEMCNREYNSNFGTRNDRIRATAIKNGYWTGLSEEEYRKKYYQEHKDEHTEWNREYYQKNRDKIRDKQRSYYQENKDRICEQQKEYYRKKKEIQNNVH